MPSKFVLRSLGIMAWYWPAAQFFGFAVEVSPSHSRAEIAGGFFYVVDRVENGRVKYCHGYAEYAAVFLDQSAVARKVARIHADKGQGEGKLVVPLDLLEELGHEHGVLAAGNADRNVVAFFDQLILDDCFFKAAFQVVLEFFPYAFFYIFLTAGGIVPVQGSHILNRHLVLLLSKNNHCKTTAHG